MANNLSNNGGYRYLAASPNAEEFKPSKRSKQKLPPKVDLRKYMTKVEKQKSLSSGTANATAGAYEYLAKRHLKNRQFEVSRLLCTITQDFELVMLSKMKVVISNMQ